MPEISYLGQLVRCELLVVRCNSLDFRAEDYQAFQKCEKLIAQAGSATVEKFAKNATISSPSLM